MQEVLYAFTEKSILIKPFALWNLAEASTLKIRSFLVRYFWSIYFRLKLLWNLTSEWLLPIVHLSFLSFWIFLQDFADGIWPSDNLCERNIMEFDFRKVCLKIMRKQNSCNSFNSIIVLKKDMVYIYSSPIHVFFIRKPFFCLSLNFFIIMLGIRLRFS